MNIKVYGHPISPDVMNSSFIAMDRTFNHYALRRALEDRGVPSERWTSVEAANRLLQKWRRQGLVHYIHKGKQWQKRQMVDHR